MGCKTQNKRQLWKFRFFNERINIFSPTRGSKTSRITNSLPLFYLLNHTLNFQNWRLICVFCGFCLIKNILRHLKIFDFCNLLKIQDSRYKGNTSSILRLMISSIKWFFSVSSSLLETLRQMGSNRNACVYVSALMSFCPTKLD